MSWKQLMLSLVVPALLGTAANAADMAVKARPMPPAPPVPVVSWTGCYIGGHLGGAFSQENHNFDDGRILSEGFNNNMDSIIGGGQLGCQYQFYNSWVIGAEGTWSALNFDEMSHSNIVWGDTRHFHSDQIVTAVGKLGYTWDRWMLYGVGGWAATRMDMNVWEPAFNASWDNNGWRDGFTAGGGFEYMPWQFVVVGAEFDWYHFNMSGNGIDNTGFVNSWNGHEDMFAATARLSFLFNFWGYQSQPVAARY